MYKAECFQKGKNKQGDSCSPSISDHLPIFKFSLGAKKNNERKGRG